MSEYEHRNGETEPPTEEGHYWLEGKLKKAKYGFLEFGEGWGDPLPHYVFPGGDRIYLGTDETVALSDFAGRFWGPVDMPIPPWDVTP